MPVVLDETVVKAHQLVKDASGILNAITQEVGKWTALAADPTNVQDHEVSIDKVNKAFTALKEAEHTFYDIVFQLDEAAKVVKDYAAASEARIAELEQGLAAAQAASSAPTSAEPEIPTGA